MNHEDEMKRDDQILDFLLDELSARERDEFEAAIDVDAALANELTGLGTVVALLEGAPEGIWAEGDAVELPALDIAAIAAGEPPHRVSVNGASVNGASPRGEPDRRRWRFAHLMDVLGARPALAGALTALVFLLGASVGLLAAGDDGGAPRLGEDATPTLVLKAVRPANEGAAGKMWWDGSTRTMRFEFDGLERLPRGEYYETWISKGDGKDEEISLGAFLADADGSASLTVPAPVDPARYPRIEVTRERADGNPASSGIVVLGARLSAAARRAIDTTLGTAGDSGETQPSDAGDRSSGDERQSDRGGGDGGDDGSDRGAQNQTPQANQPGSGDRGSDTAGEANPSDDPGGEGTEPVPPLLPLPLPPLPPLPLPEQPSVNDPLLDSLTDRLEGLPRLGQTDR